MRLGESGLTKNLQSHSLRRGAAQHVNSSAKIPIQWLCTRGNWMMDSLSKAFAYIITTLDDDKKVAKRLSSWDTDEHVECPQLRTLLHTMESEEAEKLRHLQQILFQQCRGFPGENGYNINEDVMHMSFAILLIHEEQL
jgi:hypothetical protein